MQSTGIIYDRTFWQRWASKFTCIVGHPKSPDETAGSEKMALEQDESLWQAVKFLTQNKKKRTAVTFTGFRRATISRHSTFSYLFLFNERAKDKPEAGRSHTQTQKHSKFTISHTHNLPYTICLYTVSLHKLRLMHVDACGLHCKSVCYVQSWSTLWSDWSRIHISTLSSRYDAEKRN